MIWYLWFTISVLIFGLVMNSMIVASVVTNLDNAMVEDQKDTKLDSGIETGIVVNAIAC